MSSEQKHNISSVRFFFLINIIRMTCERTLISAPLQPKKAPQNLLLYGKFNSGLQILYSSDIDWIELIGCSLKAPCQCICGIHCGNAVNACLNRITAD